jgi:pyruvate, water dikinase
VPDVIDDPAIVMLWGITRESLDAWLNAGSEGEPERAQGLRRLERRGRRHRAGGEVGRGDRPHPAGDILVCQVTNPTWAPIFQKIAPRCPTSAAR